MSFNITAFVTNFIRQFGYLGIGAIIFAESGLFLGFILPGDSLIFLGGLLASQGDFNIWTLVTVIFFTALAGDNFGYLVGRKLGRRVFNKANSFIFNHNNLMKAEEFFDHYGKMTFLMQRFIPVVRAFAPLLGGVGKMQYRIFFLFDLVGTAVWGIGVTLLGYYLGSVIPNVDNYLLPLVLLIVVLSLIPTAITYKRQKRTHSETK